ncbi:competence/damage-inducible protein A [Basilea psittacipulmonis]|uniref:MoaB/Mog domain-containing protein n=1 Tax=Basilea psittacipulmonis DSM 24701 TaxID=1072685 RepID=A0A077DHG4_9BURK|nr:molybdopterin-binding protein [Basilea psittacipulmonis]AIL32987.1 hypothetical protein IX83_06375 [Basilea psittacipulmonis DSM 24701]
MNTNQKIGLYIIGDEILNGHRQDKHLSKVIEILAQHQLKLSWAYYLPDDMETLVSHFKRSFASQDIVFSCGGIGSTPDDKTRQAAAQALNLPLEGHPEAIQLITERIEYMAKQGKASPNLDAQDNYHRLQMGYFPKGSDIIPNAFNRIPGFYIRHHSFVPGFPEMAWDMIQWTLTHRYPHLARSTSCTFRLDCYEIPESNLTTMLMDIEQKWPSIRTSSLPSEVKKDQPYHTELSVTGPQDVALEAFTFMKDTLEKMGARFIVLT